jgi:hypothetical protein
MSSPSRGGLDATYLGADGVACMGARMDPAERRRRSARNRAPPDVAKQGFTYGYANNHPAAEAPALALTQCQISPSAVKDNKLRARCKVIATYHDQCVAVAMDPANGTPGVGWAIQSDLRSAESQALAQCEKTAGPGRRAACKVDHSKCDGSAKWKGRRNRTGTRRPGTTPLEIRRQSVDLPIAVPGRLWAVATPDFLRLGSLFSIAFGAPGGRLGERALRCRTKRAFLGGTILRATARRGRRWALINRHRLLVGVADAAAQGA